MESGAAEGYSILHLALLMFPHGTTRTGFISFTVRGPLRSLAPLAAGHGCKGPGVATTGDAACASAAFNFCEALFLAFLRAFSSAAEQR